MSRRAILTRELTFAIADGGHVGGAFKTFQAGERIRLLKIAELDADGDDADFGVVEAYLRRREGRTITGGKTPTRDPEDLALVRIGEDRFARLVPREAIAFDDGGEISRALCDAAANWKGRPVEAGVDKLST